MGDDSPLALPSPRSAGSGPGRGRHPPLPPAYVHRPRVDALLDVVPHRRLTVVVAPAGTGKTVAVAGWAGARPELDVHWLTPADGAYDDPRLLAASTMPSGPAVVVLDDAHLTPSLAAALVEGILERPAEAPAVLLLAREEVHPPPLALRLAGQVAELGYPDLRFTPEEAERLVRAQRPGIDDDRVSGTVDLCRGWAAALVLEAQSARGPAPGAAPPAPSRALVDYATANVLLDLPPPLRQVLTAVCQEPEVDVEQACALSGLVDAGRLLGEAAAVGFVVETADPRSEGGAVWHIPPLLAEVLRRRTAPDGPDHKVLAAAHRRAAEHYARAGDARAAMRHAMLSGELQAQLRALRRYVPELVARGDGRDARQALGVVPHGIRTSFVQTLALDALVLRSLGRHDDAKDAADKALAAADRPSRLESLAGGARDTDADVAVADVWEARCGWRHPQSARARAARVLGCAEPERTSGVQPAHDHDTSGITPLRSAWLMLDLAALELWSDDLDSAAVHIGGGEAYSGVVDLPRLSAAARALRAFLELVQGSYQTAAQTAGTALDVIAERGVTAETSAATAHLVRGTARFLALDLEGAAADLAAARAAASDPYSRVLRVYGRILAGDLLTASGDAPAAERLFAEEDSLAHLPCTALRDLSIARIRSAVATADVPTIAAAGAVLEDAGCALEADYARGLVLGLAGDVTAAVDLLDRALAGDGPADRSRRTAGPAVGRAAEAAAAMAVARVAFLLRAATPEAANRARHLLPDALTRLAPQRLLWLAVTGQMIAPRFAEHLDLEAARADGHPFAEVAARALHRQPREHLAVAPAAPSVAAREAAAGLGLTPRELDVLEGLAVGGTNAAVAASLYLSENTVKTHVAALYRKLGVSSRHEAVAAARRSGLL